MKAYAAFFFKVKFLACLVLLWLRRPYLAGAARKLPQLKENDSPTKFLKFLSYYDDLNHTSI